MRKGRFGDGLYIIMASTVATLGSWFGLHGGRMGCGTLRYGIPMISCCANDKQEFAAAVIASPAQQLVMSLKNVL